jgi:cell division protein FtsL
MLKLILCLASAVLVAVVLLQLRQQRLELNYESNRLHNQIEAQQARLWSQQLDIALYTAPNAISATVQGKDLKLVPQSPQHVGPSNWMLSQ